MAAGADAADQMDAAFRQIIDNDPEIQAVIRSVWGNTSRDERPSDTPKNLESANERASKRIGDILRRKGIDLPDRTFINPRSGTIEGHRGWAGLNGIQRAAIIAAAAAATGGAFGAAGAFGGAGGAGGGGAAAGGGSAFASGLPVVAGAPALTGASLVTPWAGAVAPSMIGTGMAPGLSASTLAGGGSTAAGGGGLMSRLRGALSNPGNVAETVGTVAQGIGNSAQQDRQAGIDYGLLRDRLGIDNASNNESALVNRGDLELRQNLDQRNDLNNAFDKSLQAELIRGWPGATQMPSRIPTFNVGPTSPTQSARDMAGSMSTQMRGVVDQGGRRGAALPEYSPYTLTSPAERPGASTTEKVADAIGLGGNALSNILNPPNQVSDLDKWLAILKDRR
jgi:hypothetical protein